MSALFLIVGVVLAGMILASVTKLQSQQLRLAGVVAAFVVLLSFFTLASFRFVGEDQIGVVTKNIGFTSLPPGKIIHQRREGSAGADLAARMASVVLAVHLRHRIQ
jgi:hypothetical protein